MRSSGCLPCVPPWRWSAACSSDCMDTLCGGPRKARCTDAMVCFRRDGIWLRCAVCLLAAGAVDVFAAPAAVDMSEAWLGVAMLLGAGVVLLLRRSRLQRELEDAAGRFALLESRYGSASEQSHAALDAMALEIARYRRAVGALRARRQSELVG